MTLASLLFCASIAGNSNSSQIRTTEVTTLSRLAREAHDPTHQISISTPLSERLIVISSGEKNAWIKLCQTASALGLEQTETEPHRYSFQGKLAPSAILEADQTYVRDILKGGADCARLLSAMSSDEIKAYERDVQSQIPAKPAGAAIIRARELMGRVHFTRTWQQSRLTAEIISLISVKTLLQLLGLKRPSHDVASLKWSALPAELSTELRQKFALGDTQWSVNVRAVYVPTKYAEFRVSLHEPGKADEVSIGSFHVGPIRQGGEGLVANAFRPQAKPFEEQWSLEELVASITGPTTIVALIPTQSLKFSDKPTPGLVTAVPVSARASYRNRLITFDQQIIYESVTPEVMRVLIDDPLSIENWPRWSSLYEKARPLFSEGLTDIEYKSLCEQLTDQDLNVLDSIDYTSGGLDEKFRARIRYARVFKWVFTQQAPQAEPITIDLSKVPATIQRALYRFHQEPQQFLLWSNFDRTFQPVDVPRLKVKLSSSVVNNIKTLGVSLTRTYNDKETELAQVSVIASG